MHFNSQKKSAFTKFQPYSPFFRAIPEGDILIHAGDFTRCGNLQEVREFNTWLGTLPHKHKIVIAGNHELSFDQEFRNKMQKSAQESQNSSEEVGASQIDLQTPFSPRMVYCGRRGNDAHSAFSASGKILFYNSK